LKVENAWQLSEVEADLNKNDNSFPERSRGEVEVKGEKCHEKLGGDRMKAAGGEFFFADRKERKFHGGN
jgi:hypothetical protein